MNAQIIPFRKAWVPPEHWTGHDHYIFDYLREYQGMSIEEASAQIESGIEIRRIRPGESRDDRLLRMARESLAALRRRE
jgi:hypothetical protein